MTHTTLPSAAERVLVGIFLLALFVPFAGTLAGAGGVPMLDENREAAPLPGWPRDRAALGAWPEAFTRYYADRFAFRSQLVRWQARLRVEWLGASPTTDVLLGREGWLFYATDGAVDDYAGARPFSPAELESWRATLQDTQDWLERRGIAYLFLLAPDKHWVYPEYMAGGVNRGAEQGRVDQLLDYLRARSSVGVLDVRAALDAERAGTRLYHRTDTHWNDVGAFVAYREVMARVGPRLGIRAYRRDELDLHTMRRPGMDLARMLGLGRVLVEEDLQLEPHAGRRARVVEPAMPSAGLMDARVVTEGPPDGPRVVVFRDSFASAMIPFLSEHFSRAVYAWQTNFDPDMVEHERPALVIQEWVGRHLYNTTPYNAVAADAGWPQQ